MKLIRREEVKAGTRNGVGVHDVCSLMVHHYSSLTVILHVPPPSHRAYLAVNQPLAIGG